MRPSSPTCADRTLDFFVVDKLLAPAVHSVVPIGDATFSPHCPVRLLLRAKPRKMTIRHISAPKGFLSYLPAGPLRHAEDLPGEELAEYVAGAEGAIELPGNDVLNYKATELMRRTEWQLADCLSLAPAERRLHRGREIGPRLCWKSILDSKANERAYTSHASRAWRRTEKWLAVVRRALSYSFIPTVSSVFQVLMLMYPHPHLPGRRPVLFVSLMLIDV